MKLALASRINAKLKKALLKTLYRLEKKVDRKTIERSLWIVESGGDVDAEEIADAIRQMIDITKNEGYETALIKTVDGVFYYITGLKDEIFIPREIFEKLEIELHAHRLTDCPDCTLSGADIIGLYLAVNTIKKEVLICIGDSTMFYKVYSLKEGKREELKEYLKSILKDELKFLEYMYDATNIDYDKELSKFFDITVYHNVEEMIRNVFPINKPRKFDDIIQYIKRKYDTKLLDEQAEEIKKAIEDVIQRKTTSC